MEKSWAYFDGKTVQPSNHGFLIFFKVFLPFFCLRAVGRDDYIGCIHIKSTRTERTVIQLTLEINVLARRGKTYEQIRCPLARDQEELWQG